VWLGMDVDERKSKRLVGWRPTDAKRGHHRWPLEQIITVVDSVNRATIDLNRLCVEYKSVLFFTVRPAQSRTNHKIVMPAGRVNQLHEPRQNVIGRGAHFLNRDQIEFTYCLGEYLHDFRFVELRPAEHLNVKRGELNRTHITGRYRGITLAR